LQRADTYYRRADGGMALYPADCRVGVRAARLIYSEIGRVVARNHYDSVSRRAYTSKARKLFLLLRALRVRLYAGSARGAETSPAVQFLVDSV
jgi:phytoene synthase